MTPLDYAPPQFLLERTVKISHPEPGTQGGSQGPKRIINVTIGEPAATWLRDALSEIEELTTLPRDWDGYGAEPVNASAAMSAVNVLLKIAYPKLTAPEIVPVSDGGLQVEWHRNGVDVELMFRPDEPERVYIEDREGEVDPVVATGDDAVNAVNRLLGRLSVT